MERLGLPTASIITHVFNNTAKAMTHQLMVILTNRWVKGLNDHELVDHVRYLFQLSDDEDFLETHCGGIRDFDSIDEFLRYKRESQVEKASRLRKRNLYR